MEQVFTKSSSKNPMSLLATLSNKQKVSYNYMHYMYYIIADTVRIYVTFLITALKTPTCKSVHQYTQ